ncbi:MAG: phosphoadenylyl-sulfate reductase [Pseudomonadales bacterium]|jgi:phosphoadenosine phosphosulfate reductase|nr:phosphoadenylyl-sulfate reductase [Pseudomonadales bacterium]MDP6473099.1 phosphoadenylyl-sulfate reductase [Pseudomonadales bacterium]MDP6826144.1 phosphoadenylyl-sulfate reductase [Pseudomonadales bacterium]MDP6971857.1 phosphoadenylyl-sulfate reductase [Pseudomonadales bacterium]|tara:strand:+ start:1260 stop:1979 length:720 start_codon:yes stop_codon:yes gene_type:complete
MEPRKASIHDDTPQRIIADAIQRYGEEELAISFSGAEDVVLVDMAHKLGLRPGVFALDTGRLHPETYRFFETVRDHYDTPIELLMPQPEAVASLVREKGMFSFLNDGHSECCAVRKIEPLRRKLSTLDAWITGQRQDQSVTRNDVPHKQVDRAFSSAEHTLMKFNPLSEWSSGDVWAYIRANGVPYNALHDQGFVSIGCEPCTRPVGPHEHERAGRWWWEEATQKECGLHAQNVVKIIG